jgi:hypothetical protein
VRQSGGTALDAGLDDHPILGCPHDRDGCDHHAVGNPDGG